MFWHLKISYMAAIILVHCMFAEAGDDKRTVVDEASIWTDVLHYSRLRLKTRLTGGILWNPWGSCSWLLKFLGLIRSKKLKLVKVESLVDRMQFLGTVPSFSLPAGDCTGFEGNRFYFTACCFDIFFDGNHGSNDFGVFNFEDGGMHATTSTL